MHEAFGDHQVANVTAEVEARTIGASVRWPALAPGRHTDVNPYFGIPHFGAFPFDGSALVVWDTRHPGAADHEHAAARGPGPARRAAQQPAARAARSPSSCNRTARVIDVCDGAPCVP